MFDGVKKKNLTFATIAALIGIISFIGFGYYTNWQAAVCLFFALWSDNISQYFTK